MDYINKEIIIITGSSGLIGSQAAKFFHDRGFYIIGIDNDMRSYFFGMNASTTENKNSLIKAYSNFTHYDIDIRDFNKLSEIFRQYSTQIKLIIHTAAQPSHDWAAKEPITDFTVNANGTLNLLEATRLYAPDAVFIFTSTNKVYGDRPNLSYNTGVPDQDYKGMLIKELDTRWEAYFENNNLASVDETMSVDNTKHSLFGVSKLSADVLCQEYGKYFGMNIGIFRGGCLTGPNHAGAELHGFLSYLIKCIIQNKHYTIFGYKGKQVRDNIHSYDLVNMFWHFYQKPQKGTVYNVGGGRENSISILEAINKVNHFANLSWSNFTVDPVNRIGDHIWYITDLTKFKIDYPGWDLKYSIDDTLQEMIRFEQKKNL